MRLVFTCVLLLGVFLAGTAAYLARDYLVAHRAALESERSVAAASVPTQQVFITARTVRYGEALTPADLRIVSFPQDAVPSDAFLTADALFPKGRDVPRSVTRTMEAGEVVLAAKVTAAGEEAGVTSRLNPGMRAFAIGVDVASGVSGFLRPGDRVDIYWTGSVALDGQSRDVTRLIQAGVPLIAVDQSADENRSEATVARTVTVEVTPRQVAALAQAQSTGALSLSLIGAKDDSLAETVEIDQGQLLDLSPRQMAKADPPKICTIRTRRGSDVAEMPIPCSE